MMHETPAPAENDFPEPEFLDGAAPKPHECTMAMLAHLGGLLFSFLPPAYLMLKFQDRSHYVVRHAREAVNFQLTLFFYAFLILIPSAGVGFAVYTCNVRWLIALLVGAIVGLVLSIIVAIIATAIIVMACLAAGKGREYRYPFTIRLI